MRIRPLTVLDEGYYQCRAFNMHGRASSPMTVLQRADIGSYPSSDPNDEMGLVEGTYHMIRCQPVKCFPEPSFTWALARKGTLDEAPTAIVTNKRIQIDDQGLVPSLCATWSTDGRGYLQLVQVGSQPIQLHIALLCDTVDCRISSLVQCYATSDTTIMTVSEFACTVLVMSVLRFSQRNCIKKIHCGYIVVGSRCHCYLLLTGSDELVYQYGFDPLFTELLFASILLATK